MREKLVLVFERRVRDRQIEGREVALKILRPRFSKSERFRELFEFSASHYTAEDLFRARHTCDLQARPEVILNLDCIQRGLGTGSCGPDTLPRYRIRAGLHRFAYRIRAAR